MIKIDFSEFSSIDWLIFFGHIEVIILAVILGILFLLNRRDKPLKLRKYLLAVSIFILCFAISRIVLLYYSYFLRPTIITLYEDPKPLLENSVIGGLYHDIFWRISAGVMSIGLLIFLDPEEF